MAFGNTMEELLDEHERATCEPTIEGLSCVVPCTRCGQQIPCVEPWAPRQGRDESSVVGAFKSPPQDLRVLVNHARTKLPAGAGFSYITIDETPGGTRGALAFCVFVKCPMCQDVAVGDFEVSRIRGMMQTQLR